MVHLGNGQAHVLGVSHITLMQFHASIDGHNKLLISLYFSLFWQVTVTCLCKQDGKFFLDTYTQNE